MAVGVSMAHRRVSEVLSESSDQSLCAAMCVPSTAYRQSSSAFITDHNSIAVAASSSVDGSDVSCCPMFVVSGDNVEGQCTGPDVWRQFHEKGRLSACPLTGSALPVVPPSREGSTVASAVCVSRTVSAGGTDTASFSLAWDCPAARFGAGKAVYRYYTSFFGRAGSAASSLASYGLAHCHRWERDIFAWQEVNREELVPPYYRHQLYNELYYLVDGGTIWSTSGLHEGGGDISPTPDKVAVESGEAEHSHIVAL